MILKLLSFNYYSNIYYLLFHVKTIKPKQLIKGDTVGIVSPSWGGPYEFPHIYESGIIALKKMGLKIKEFSNTRQEAAFLYNNPELRAIDINNAFLDTEVKAIFSSIGGDDSIRILPYLDIDIIKSNPKIFIGYSDTTTINTYLNQLGLITFNGPSVMAGFSQWNNHEKLFQQFIEDFMFGNIEHNEYQEFQMYTDGYPNWSDKKNTGKNKPHNKNDGWRWLQGKLKAEGQLFGGCIEVLEFMKGTDFWPIKDFWNNKILFLETSECKPTIEQVKWMLRNYGIQ